MSKPKHIFAEYIEGKALSQFEEAMKQDFVTAGALMPDAHTGYTLPIGAVVACKDVVVPSYVGYDIGCGMCAIKVEGVTKEAVQEHSEEIYNQILRDVPVGFNRHKLPQDWYEGDKISRSPIVQDQIDKGCFAQLGTLGGGNHFIEIGADEGSTVWVIIHSGSRNLGHTTATEYMKIASGSDKAKEGHFAIPANSMAGQGYLMDALYCQEFALENRKQMIQAVVYAIGRVTGMEVGADFTQIINRNHNHIDIRDGVYIHRKGATHAEEGMMGVIPGNMRDGSFIVRGKGNPDSLWSSSHGAGRVLGRFKAKKVLSVDTFKEQMEGIQAGVSKGNLDEAPDAYKNIFEVMAQQKDLVEVVAHVKPLINVKG